MTIKKISEVFNVSRQTVIRAVKELYPTKVQKGKTTNLLKNEAVKVGELIRRVGSTKQIENLIETDKKTMSKRELEMFFGVSSATLTRRIKKLDIIMNKGKKKMFDKDEVEKIANDLYVNLPLAIKESIDETFKQPVSNDISQPVSNDISQNKRLDKLEVLVESLVEITKANLIQTQKLLENNNQVKQLPETPKMSVKEYCIANNISAYNVEQFLKDVGRVATRTSKDLNRSIKYENDGQYNIGKYDIDILKHSVEMVKIENDKKKSLSLFD